MIRAFLAECAKRAITPLPQRTAEFMSNGVSRFTPLPWREGTKGRGNNLYLFTWNLEPGLIFDSEIIK